MNGEEKHVHEKWREDNQFVALSKEEHDQVHRRADEREIVMLEGELNLTRNRLDQANHYIDKMTNQRDRVNGAINLYKRGKRLEGVTLDDIRMIMRHPL